MQTLSPKPLPHPQLLRQPLRHRHTPMHARHAINQNHDALAPGLTLHSPPERVPSAVEFVIVCWEGEEAFAEVVV